MTYKDLKTGMLLLMDDDVLRLVVGKTAISATSCDGGSSLKDLSFNNKALCGGWNIQKVYAEPLPTNDDWSGASFKYWLKDKHFLDEEYNPKLLWEYKELEYPMWFRQKIKHYVVKFTKLESGVVVLSDMTQYPIGYTTTNWYPHTDTSIWERVEDPNALQDKDATWCWNNSETLRHLCFWDAKYNSIFRANGNRNGPKYDNFEKILREDEPNWCNKAREVLINDD